MLFFNQYATFFWAANAPTEKKKNLDSMTRSFAAVRDACKSESCIHKAGYRVPLSGFVRFLRLQYKIPHAQPISRGVVAAGLSDWNGAVFLKDGTIRGISVVLRLGRVHSSLIPSTYFDVAFLILLAARFRRDCVWSWLPPDILLRILQLPSFVP